MGPRCPSSCDQGAEEAVCLGKQYSRLPVTVLSLCRGQGERQELSSAGRRTGVGRELSASY